MAKHNVSVVKERSRPKDGSIIDQLKQDSLDKVKRAVFETGLKFPKATRLLEHGVSEDDLTKIGADLDSQIGLTSSERKKFETQQKQDVLTDALTKFESMWNQNPEQFIDVAKSLGMTNQIPKELKPYVKQRMADFKELPSQQQLKINKQAMDNVLRSFQQKRIEDDLIKEYETELLELRKTKALFEQKVSEEVDQTKLEQLQSKKKEGQGTSFLSRIFGSRQAPNVINTSQGKVIVEED